MPDSAGRLADHLCHLVRELTRHRQGGGPHWIMVETVAPRDAPARPGPRRGRSPGRHRDRRDCPEETAPAAFPRFSWRPQSGNTCGGAVIAGRTGLKRDGQNKDGGDWDGTASGRPSRRRSTVAAAGTATSAPAAASTPAATTNPSRLPAANDVRRARLPSPVRKPGNTRRRPRTRSGRPTSLRASPKLPAGAPHALAGVFPFDGISSARRASLQGSIGAAHLRIKFCGTGLPNHV
jgi:hypothetical protein